MLVESGGLGIQRIGLFNKALLGKWLWHFGKERNRLWCQVVSANYGEGRGGWCTRGVRGSHGCGMWRNIKEGTKKFFSQILYNVGEGCCVSFWHDPWCGPIPLKELFPATFACSLSKEAWVSNLVISISEGGKRSLEFTFLSWSSGL